MKVEVTNAAEIRALLDSIPRAYQPATQKKILTKAAAPLVSTIRNTTPVAKRDHRARGNTIPRGTLKKSMGAIDSKRSKYVSLIIGARVKGAYGGYKGGWYAHFVGLDRKVYSITGGRVRRGTPWVQNAWAAKQAEVRRRIDTEAKAVFEKAVNRLRLRGKL